jgi:uncharacterized protein
MATCYFRTYSGIRIHPLSPLPGEIVIEDLAHALSRICRFVGHTTVFYSVAQHSVLVSQRVPPEDALWGLLHDAAEAYLCDLPAPIKHAPEMAAYRLAEDRLMLAVCAKFGLKPGMPHSVAVADKILLATEFRDVTTVTDTEWISGECGQEPLSGEQIVSWPPIVAEELFIARFKELTR